MNSYQNGSIFRPMPALAVLIIATTMPTCMLDVAAQEGNAPAGSVENSEEMLFENFSIDVGPLVAQFDQQQIVSDPPVLEASFYQKNTTPRIIVPPSCEAYLLTPQQRNNDYTDYRIVGRRPKGKPINGAIYMLRRHPDQPRESVLAKFDFSLDSTDETKVSTVDFHKAKGQHFQTLWSPQYAGSAMFRHLATESMKAAGLEARAVGPNWPLRSDEGVNSTIKMMAGGRAISENLALNNDLDNPESYLGELVELSNVRGIQVDAIDWKDRLSKKQPELDPLSKLVSEDQYAVFLPSFNMLSELVSRGSDRVRPFVHWFEPQSRVTDVMGMYQSQLGLPMNALTRQVGGALVGEVAVTGSDPYFRTGTDVAVLMQSEQATVLHQAMLTLIKGQSAKHNDVERIEHKVDDHTFTQWVNPSRSFSSCIAITDDAVVVSNSPYQIRRVLQCSSDRVATMHDLDEYKFFRQRYPRNSQNPKTLVVITDAAIRRWCGPQWRISASRRTRARATIAEVTMQHADALVRGTTSGKTEIYRDSQMPKAGVLILTPDGVYSDEYGSLDFQTPIAEMNLTHATQKEVDLYSSWLRRYERKWRRVFDPIAIEIGLTDKELAVDLTVIPLILQSEYAQYRRIVGKARLKPTIGDLHPESIASVDLAIDTETPMFNMARMFVQSQLNGVDLDPLGWIDGSVSLYFDHDEAWMKRYEGRDRWSFQFNSLAADLPIGVHIPSKDSLSLTSFMVGIRSLQNQYAPNMIRWGTDKHKDYVFVTGTWDARGALGEGAENPTLYYVTLPDGLTLSGNQQVIKRAIDRHIANEKNGKPVDQPDEQETVAASEVDPAKVLEPQMVMKVTGQVAEVMSQTSFRRGLWRSNQLAWSNLPILNYFRHRYPDRDPAQVYSQLFGQTLIEPTGGEYVWNKQRSTYESTHHGYHLEPKAGPILANTFGPSDTVETTLSFQDGGLRATLKMTDNE